MPDRKYIEKQLKIAGDEKYPQSMREDALCRAMSNSNLHGVKYPTIEDISSAHLSVLQAFVYGKIDLNEIQEQGEQILLGDL